MSERNPKTALEAIFPKTIEVLGCVSVYPLTLAHYALLEQTNSYLVNVDHTPDALETVRTMYICCHDAAETMANFRTLDTDAMAWAQTLPPAVVNEVMDAVKKQIDAMMAVVPMLGDTTKKKAVTD